MNKNFIRVNDDTYVVMTDKGEPITYTVNSDVNNELFNEILTTENDIELLQKILWDLECKKSNLDERRQFSKEIYLKGIPILFVLFEVLYLLLAQSGFSLQSVLFSLGTSVFTATTFNVGFNGPLLGSNNKVKKIASEIKMAKDDLDLLYKEIEMLKSKTDYEEVENSKVYEVKPIDRTHEEDMIKPLTRKLEK